MAVIFSKILTKTDVEKRLAVPSKHLKCFPRFKGHEHAVNIEAIDDQSGKICVFQCSIRKKNHLKPVISKGWVQYVRNRQLRVGDKVKFYREAGGNYRIKVKKSVRIFGVVIGYAPARG
ncbi:hypothetical protein COLO4_17739 [Corchorus olitorius]|uniref:TF-B3 domain-containing protein n=1 Tax=Corchorus olitorius TaxID=93759 RepID=A0A1R3JBL7_9ROSI|nr:hypothetical protein COLO4_17739 [Corchorus olitorius]